MVVLIVMFNTFVAYHKVEDQSENSRYSILRRLFFDQVYWQFLGILSLVYTALCVSGSVALYCMACACESLELKYYNRYTFHSNHPVDFQSKSPFKHYINSWNFV